MSETDRIKEFSHVVDGAVRRMHIRHPGSDDARQIGLMAIVEACRTFKPSKGSQLSTWVYSKVNWRISNWVDQQCTQGRVEEIPGECNTIQTPEDILFKVRIDARVKHLLCQARPEVQSIAARVRRGQGVDDMARAEGMKRAEVKAILSELTELAKLARSSENLDADVDSGLSN